MIMNTGEYYFGKRYRILAQGNRFVPQVWATLHDPNQDHPERETGYWKDALPDGMYRLTLGEAIQDLGIGGC